VIESVSSALSQAHGDEETEPRHDGDDQPFRAREKSHGNANAESGKNEYRLPLPAHRTRRYATQRKPSLARWRVTRDSSRQRGSQSFLVGLAD
jgi:hypothetical protein